MDYAAAVEFFFAPAPDDVTTPATVADATPARRLRDGVITDGGRRFRDAIEAATDAGRRDLVEAIGDDLDDVTTRLDGCSQACIDARAFPVDLRERAAG